MVIFLYCPTCVEAVLLNGDDAVDCRVRGKAGPGGRSGGSGSRRDGLGRQTGETDWGVKVEEPEHPEGRKCGRQAWSGGRDPRNLGQ